MPTMKQVESEAKDAVDWGHEHLKLACPRIWGLGGTLGQKSQGV